MNAIQKALGSLAALAALACLTASAAADPPSLIRSEPADGATDVAADVGVLRFFFDRNMKENGWSLVESERGPFPPLASDDCTSWTSPTCFEIEVDRLEAATTYAIQLNSETRTGFRSALENEALPATVVSFRTAGGRLSGRTSRDLVPPPTEPPPAPAEPPAAPAAPTDTPLGDIPGLTVSTPAPPWAKPGVRLTYYTLTGNLPAGQHHFVIDANGRWQDSAGRSYDRKEMAKSGSHGFLQANVVSLDAREAAVQMVFFLFDGMNVAEPIQKLETGYVASAGTCGDLWLHPDAMQRILKDGLTGMLVSRTKHQIDQATYDALQIISQREHGRGVWIYDLASGILLYSSNLTRTGETSAQSGEQLSPGGQLVRFNTFKASRVPKLPWAGQPPPAWLQRIGRIDYGGKFWVEIQGDIPRPMPFQLGLKVTRRGADWLQLEVVSASQAPGAIPETSVRVSGNRQLCGLWIPPQGLAGLRPGQVIDSDPLTKVVTTVAQVDAQAVVIAQQSPKQRYELTYRRSDGLLARAVFRESLGVPGMANVVELQLAGTR